MAAPFKGPLPLTVEETIKYMMKNLKEKLPDIPLHSEVDAVYINYHKRQNISYYDFYIVYYSESSSDLYFAKVKRNDEEMINLVDKDEIINYLAEQYKK